MDITTLIGSYAFPIVACCAMGWYVKYITDKHSEDYNQLTTQHETETNSLKDAINNNTIAITKLCERLGSTTNN